MKSMRSWGKTGREIHADPVLEGAYRRDDGVITMDGAEVNPRSTKDSQTLGIGTVYQEVNLLPNLTVAENLFLGRQPMRGPFLARRKMKTEARRLLRDYGVDIDPAEPLSSFSVAIQQVIAIARAVELSGKVLILDEPAASLDREEIQLIFSVIRKLRDRGLAIVFITHFLDQVFDLRDCATILRDGRVVGHRALKDVTHKDIVMLMLGRQLESHSRGSRSKAAAGAPLIETDGLGRSGMLEPLSLTAHEGEVVGLAGCWALAGRKR